MRPLPDRIGFRADQRLLRSDLAQCSQRTRTLLELHTARVHDVWGVASGFLCAYDVATDTVAVGPGVALDSHGRQLVNPTTRTLRPPPDPEGAQLVAHWLTESVPGCPPRGFPDERSGLRWLPADHAPRLGAEVPIARLGVAADGAGLTVDTSSRPVAHGLVRPKIVTGHVLQGTASVQGSFANWSMFVSTAGAGFVSPSPVYVVSLEAHPFGDTADLGFVADTREGPPELATRLRWPGPFVSVASKDNTGFWLHVATASGPGWAREATPGTNPVPVSWVGIETPDPGPFAGWYAFLFSLPMMAVIG